MRPASDSIPSLQSIPFIIAPSSREPSPNHSIHVLQAKVHFAQFYMANRELHYQRGAGIFFDKLRSSRGAGKGLWAPKAFASRDVAGISKRGREEQERDGEMKGVLRGIPNDMEEFEEWEVMKRKTRYTAAAQIEVEHCKGEVIEEWGSTTSEKSLEKTEDGKLGRLGGRRPTTSPESTLKRSRTSPKAISTAVTINKKVRLTNSFNSVKTGGSSSSATKSDAPSQSQSQGSSKVRHPPLIAETLSRKGKEIGRSESTPNATSNQNGLEYEDRAKTGTMSAAGRETNLDAGYGVGELDEADVKVLFETEYSQMMLNRTLAIDSDSHAHYSANETALFPPPSFPAGLQTSTPFVPRLLESTYLKLDDGDEDSTATAESSMMMVAQLTASMMLPNVSSGFDKPPALLNSSELREERLSQQFLREAEEEQTKASEMIAASLRMISERPDPADEEESIGMTEIDAFLHLEEL